MGTIPFCMVPILFVIVTIIEYEVSLIRYEATARSFPHSHPPPENALLVQAGNTHYGKKIASLAKAKDRLPLLELPQGQASGRVARVRGSGE